MAFSYYTPEKHGYHAIRISSNFRGIERVKYFNLRGLTKAEQRRAWREAEELEAVWLEEDSESRYSYKINNAYRKNSPHSLGITGLGLYYNVSKDSLSLGYRVYGKDGKSRCFSFGSNGARRAWQRAVEYYCESRNILKADEQRILASEPNQDRLREYYRFVSRQTPLLTPSFASRLGLI